MSKIVSFAGLVGTFIVAYACERVWRYLLLKASQTLVFGTYVWLESVVILILASVLMLLAWYVVFRTRRDVWVASVFVLIGIGVTFAYAIEISLHSALILPGMEEFLAPRSYVHYAAAFVTVIGIASFVVPRRLRK
jgi:hypothetical protein